MAGNSIVLYPNKGKKEVFKISAEKNSESDKFTDITIVYSNSNKEEIIRCLVDDRQNHGKPGHNETYILPTTKDVPKHLKTILENLIHSLADVSFLPDQKKAIIETLSTTFPIFENKNQLSHENIEHVKNELDAMNSQYTAWHDSLKKDTIQYNDLTNQIVHQHNHLQMIEKKQHYVQIQEHLNNVLSADQKAELFYFTTERNDLGIQIKEASKKLKQTPKDRRQSIQNHKNNLVNVRGAYEEQLRQLYQQYNNEGTIDWANFLDYGLGVRVKSGELRKKYDKTKEHISHKEEMLHKVYFEINDTLEELYDLVTTWMDHKQQYFSYVYQYFNQEKIRKDQKRKSLRENEVPYKEMWNLVKDEYIKLRMQCNQINEIIPDGLDTSYDYNSLLVLNKSHRDTLVEMNAIIGRDLSYKQLQGNVEKNEYEMYMYVLQELDFAYRIEYNKRHKMQQEQIIQQENKRSSHVRHLPTDLKDLGLKKFDSQYFEFGKRLEKSLEELKDSETGKALSPLQYYQKNHLDIKIVKEQMRVLIESLPVYIHTV